MVMGRMGCGRSVVKRRIMSARARFPTVSPSSPILRLGRNAFLSCKFQLCEIIPRKFGFIAVADFVVWLERAKELNLMLSLIWLVGCHCSKATMLEMNSMPREDKGWRVARWWWWGEEQEQRVFILCNCRWLYVSVQNDRSFQHMPELSVHCGQTTLMPLELGS